MISALGTFLVDASGRIVHASAAGHDLLHSVDLVLSAEGRLAARNSWVDQSLREGTVKLLATGLAAAGLVE